MDNKCWQKWMRETTLKKINIRKGRSERDECGQARKKSINWYYKQTHLSHHSIESIDFFFFVALATSTLFRFLHSIQSLFFCRRRWNWNIRLYWFLCHFQFWWMPSARSTTFPCSKLTRSIFWPFNHSTGALKFAFAESQICFFFFVCFHSLSICNSWHESTDMWALFVRSETDVN